MSTDHVDFSEISNLVANKPARSPEEFFIGETLEIKGRKFVVHAIKPKKLILKLLKS